MVRNYPFWAHNSKPAPELAPNATPIKLGIQGAAVEGRCVSCMSSAGIQLFCCMCLPAITGAKVWYCWAGWSDTCKLHGLDLTSCQITVIAR